MTRTVNLVFAFTVLLCSSAHVYSLNGLRSHELRQLHFASRLNEVSHLSQSQLEKLCDWDLDCWVNEGKKALASAANWKSQAEAAIAQKVNEAKNFMKTIAELKDDLKKTGDIIDSVEQCAVELPVATSAKDLFYFFSDLIKGSTPLPQLTKKYVEPLIEKPENKLKTTLLPALQTLVAGLPKLVNDDGTINTAVLDEGTMALAHFSITVLDIDPAVACVRSNLLKFNETGLAALITPVLQPAFNAMAPVFAIVKDPVVWGAKEMIGLGLEGFETIMHDSFVGSKIKELDGILDTRINAFCSQATKSIVAFSKGVKPIPAGFCISDESPVIANIKGGLAAMLSGGLKWIIENLFDLLDDHVWQPLLIKLVSLTNSLQSTIEKLLIGLCGLLPEVGGIACASITAPIGVLVTQVTSQLTSTTVRGLIKKVQNWFLSNIPKWSSEFAGWLTDLIADAIKGGKTLAADAANKAMSSKFRTQVEAEAAKADFALTALYTLAILVVDVLMKLILPKVTSAFVGCNEDVSHILGLIRTKLCN